VATGLSTGELCLWDVRKQKNILTIEKHEDAIIHTTVSPDSEDMLITCGLDGRLLVLDCRMGPLSSPCFELLDGKNPVNGAQVFSFFTGGEFCRGETGLVTSSYESE
jgi:WD40 repeat protein